MNHEVPKNHASYVVPEQRKGRLDAQWDRIAEGLHGARRAQALRALRWGGVVLAACAVAGLWLWPSARTETPSVWAGALVTSDDAPVNFSLAEGTLIELEPRSEVELLSSQPGAVKLSIRTGSARFDVAKRRSRRFSVELGEVEVRVTGTQFRVRRSPSAGGEKIRVDVEEGSVEVHRRGATAVQLSEGEHWSTFVAEPQVAAEPVLEQLDDHVGQLAGDVDGDVNADEGDAVDSAREGSGTGARKLSKRARRRARAAEAREREQARAQQEAAALLLFEQGNAARRLGRLREAAEIYAELVNDYPKDRRAAFSSFELGRIRMDSLGDLRGGAEALERALRLDARRAFAEDALARLVLAHEALGDRRACESARNRYLARYPDGVHAQHVAGRCAALAATP
ncbi:MAG: FecR domain-containing protein [Myxococcales bacterium]